MNTDEIAYAVKLTKRLVREYEEIIDEYKERNYVMKALLNFEIGIETTMETYTRENSGSQN